MNVKQQVAALREAYGGPMSEQEVVLLRDIQGFLEFAIRNGLSFPLVVGTLSHDINAIFTRYAFSLEDAANNGFLPKVSGYRNVTEDDVGQSDEED